MIIPMLLAEPGDCDCIWELMESWKEDGGDYDDDSFHGHVRDEQSVTDMWVMDDLKDNHVDVLVGEMR